MPITCQYSPIGHNFCNNLPTSKSLTKPISYNIDIRSLQRKDIQMKRLVVILVAFYLVSCTPPPVAARLPTVEQNLATREAQITAKSEFYQDPSNWVAVPESCRRSFAKIWLYDTDLNHYESGTATLVYAEQFVKPSEKVWVYHFLTADHLVKSDTNTQLGGKTIVFPGWHSTENFQFRYLNYYQISDPEHGYLDMGLISVFGTDNLSSGQFDAIGVENVTPGDHLGSDPATFYISMGYPRNQPSPQFNISTFWMQDGPKLTMKLHQDYSNVTKGNSGGPLCDQSGKVVGVVSSYDWNSYDKIIVTANPNSIQDQLLEAMNNSVQVITANGFQTP